MVGRKEEIRILKDIYESNIAELVAIYGRRRIGKTYLVYETFNEILSFSHAGISPNELDGKSNKEKNSEQLLHFYNSLIIYGYHGPRFDNWFDAFLQLEVFLNEKVKSGKVVVFIDELPWLDVPESNFLKAFEGFWNTWACRYKNVKVIVCGSATSWMLNKLISDKNGLYNRVTREIPMKPFNLKETEELFVSKGIKLSRYDIVRAYMITGGIPYYLNYFKKGESVAKCIDRVFFGSNAVLRKEFNYLFKAIFEYPKKAEDIVRILARKNVGLSREEILLETSMTDGGTFSSILNALEYSNMVIKYNYFGNNKKQKVYKLVDPFCIFYLKFVDENSNLEPSFWQSTSLSQSVISWRGFAFENVCFLHISQIKTALEINGVSTSISPFVFKGNQERDGSQIDLVITRADNIVNLCEIKFYGTDYTQTKEDNRKLTNKIESIIPLLNKKQSIHPILITTYGLTYNEYSGDYEHTISLEDLFH